MSEPAEDRMAALEAELASTRKRLDELLASTARLEPLLRAILKRAPKRAEAAARPDAPTSVLTDEQRAAVRRRFKASQARKKS